MGGGDGCACMLVYFLEAPTQTHLCGYPGLGSTFVVHLAFHHLLLLGYDIHVRVQVAVWGWLGQIWSHFLWFGSRGIYIIIMGLGFQGGG